MNRAWPQKLDHKLRCIMEQFTHPVEGLYDGQETAKTLVGQHGHWVICITDCSYGYSYSSFSISLRTERQWRPLVNPTRLGNHPNLY